MSDNIRDEVARAQASPGTAVPKAPAATTAVKQRGAKFSSRTMLYVIIGVVILGVAGVVVATLTSGPSSLAQFDMLPVNSSAMADLRSIALNTTLANEVGGGSLTGPPYPSGTSVPLTSQGKPEILYIGANYCPYCAVTRWGFILALMRFGNFSVLRYMTSGTATGEVFPGSPTFTFYNSSYSSNLISLVTVEMETNNYTPLQTPTTQEDDIYAKVVTNNPNVPSDAKVPGGGIAFPFVDFGNVSVQATAPVSPSVIFQNTWGNIINKLSNPNSPEAQAIIGTANVFTSQICAMTGGKPASVCSQPFAKVTI